MSETLFELLEMRREIDWDAVVARLASHPNEAAIETVDFRTPLHCALRLHTDFNPMTVDVLNAFTNAYRDALLEVDEDGKTPLHVACSKNVSAQLVKILLEANPEAASVRDKYGNIPLHFVEIPAVTDLLLETYPEGVGVVNKGGCLPLHWEASSGKESSGLQVLLSLLKVGTKMNAGGVDGGGGVLVEDNKGKTPLKRACDALHDEIEDSDDDHTIYRTEGRANLLWEKVYVLARATYAVLAKRNGTIILDEDVPLLHAVIELQCPQFVIARTLSDNPHLTSVRDYRSRTPLSIAASQHDISPEIFKLLLTADYFGPRIAGMANKEKRLPLHLAAESGWDFEHLEVIRQAAPAALETRDVPTRMYPFMLAAEGPHSNLNSVFQLLRASPRMAGGMAEGIHWESSKLRLQCENREQKERIAELEAENVKLREIILQQRTSREQSRKKRKLGEH